MISISQRFFIPTASFANIDLMNKNSIMFIVLGVVAGFVAGFVFANKLNGSELNALKSQSGQQMTANSNSASAPANDTLTEEELRTKIAEADRNADNFAFQKSLGISLYRYAAMKQSISLLNESIRILTRATTLDAKDFDVFVALGNAHFDLGFFKKDLASFTTARTVYAKALAIKPGDADVSTDVGISYYVQEPPDYDKALAELQKVIAANPKHDRAMQFVVQAYAKQGKVDDAEKMLAKIIEINPTNPAITELRSEIAAGKSGAK